jgi:hypothetical protein
MIKPNESVIRNCRCQKVNVNFFICSTKYLSNNPRRIQFDLDHAFVLTLRIMTSYCARLALHLLKFLLTETTDRTLLETSKNLDSKQDSPLKLRVVHMLGYVIHKPTLLDVVSDNRRSQQYADLRL